VTSLEGDPVTVTALSDVLGLGLPDEPTNARHPAVLLQSAERRALVLVDSLVGAQEVVIKNLPRPLIRVRHAAGATILGSGEVVVILNAADVVRLSGSSTTSPALGEAAPAGETASMSASGGRTVLVADDSMVTRMLEKSILEAAGYQVLVASDGLEAWGILQTERCDLLVSDVNMPRMSGLDLTSRVRSDDRFKNFPVILVTSLDSPDDRARGIEAGADAYVVKSTFSQQGLLETINRLI
jgi:two-component system chemotaxis sensor kinase CheA